MKHALLFTLIVALLTGRHPCHAYGGPPDVVILEAESAAGTGTGTRNFAGVNGVFFEPNGQLQTSFVLEQDALVEVWLRVYFPWHASDTLAVTVDDTVKTIGQTSGRWDIGNQQVWHWITVGQLTMKAGTHNVTVQAAKGRNQRLDKIAVYTGGGQAWTEPWLTGDLSMLAGTGQRVGKNDNVIIEAENFQRIDGQTQPAGDGRAVRLERNRDKLATIVETRTARQVEIWVKLYFESKSMFEGWTMEELRNQVYMSIDGSLKRTILAMNGRLWYWAYAGTHSLEPGPHLIAFQKAIGPVRIDSIVLYAGQDATAEDWFEFPCPMPFGFANHVSYFRAERVSDWRIFGSLAQDTKMEWLGKKMADAVMPVEVRLPRKKGNLVLVKGLPLTSIEARAAHNREQQLNMWVNGDDTSIQIRAVYSDRNDEIFLATLAHNTNGKGWRLLSHNIPLSVGADDNVFFDGTGYMPNTYITPPITGCKRPTANTWAQGGDGIPDYPLEVQCLVFETDGKNESKIIFSEPFFDAPFVCTTKLVTEESSPTSNYVNVQVCLLNKSRTPRIADLYYSWAEYPYTLQDARTQRAILDYVQVSVPAGGKTIHNCTSMLKTPGLHSFSAQACQGNPSERIFAVGDAARKKLHTVMQHLEQKSGAFRFTPDLSDTPLKKKDGSPIRRDEVHALYGKPNGFTVIVDGLDVTSRHYADRINAHQRIRADGVDLSNDAGWPHIHVPCGTLAVDPQLGRFKFAQGDTDKIRVMSRLSTGFAKSGIHVQPRGDYVYSAPGEGNYSVVDVRNKEKPTIASFINSWNFTRRLFPYRNFGYIESGVRGVFLIDDISNPYRPGRVRSVNFRAPSHPCIQEIYEDKAIMIASDTNSLSINCLKHPLNPRRIGRISGAKGFFPQPSAKYAFTWVGDDLGLLDMTEPSRARLVRRCPKPATDASIAAVSEHMVAIRSGKKTVAIFSYGLDNWPPQPVASIEMSWTRPAKHLLFAFHKEYFYTINGRSGPGEYGVKCHSPSSIWRTYKINKDAAELVSTYEDPLPSAYGHLAIDGNYGYVTDYNYGLWIFDLRDPARPRKMSGIATAGEADALWTNGEYAYMWQTFGGAVFSIDVRNPYKPKRIGDYWDGAWVSYDCASRGRHTIAGKDNVYYLPRAGRGIVIVDASDPASPEMAGEFLDDKAEPVTGFGACMLVEDNRAFVFAGRPADRMLIYDVSTPAKPRLISTTGIPATDTFAKRGQFVYVAPRAKAVTILNVANEKAPALVSAMDFTEFADGLPPIRNIAATENYLYASTRARNFPTTGFYIINVTDKRKPALASFCNPLPDLLDSPCSSWADGNQDLTIAGNYLFSGNYAQIECYDITDREQPTFFDRKHVNYQWSVGQKWGDNLYVPALKGLVILDVPNSSQVPRGKLTTKTNL